MAWLAALKSLMDIRIRAEAGSNHILNVGPRESGGIEVETEDTGLLGHGFRVGVKRGVAVLCSGLLGFECAASECWAA